MTSESDARADWERRIYRRLTDTTGADPALALPAPRNVRTTPGRGHVRLDWAPVVGAAGYLIERTGPEGEPGLVQHGGADVPAVPGPPFADTGLEPGAAYSYRVAAVAGAEHPAWSWSEPVRAATTDGPGADDVTPVVRVTVAADHAVADVTPVWRMVGSERLTQLGTHDDGHGNDVGAEFAEALRTAAEDLGVTHVRAHAILHDDNRVVTRGPDGALRFDFTQVDALYDQALTLGLRPVVELSFMPAALARDPGQTVFAYRAIISPPADWAEWYRTVHALAEHLVERYGIDEVAGWGFEVWNEPNLQVFWTGTRDDYLRLYDESARALKDVDPRLLVGGPSTAAGEWVEALAAHARDEGVPLDFVTSHTYGNLPLDVRPALHRHGFDGVPVWWTEWGIGSTHFGPVHDAPLGAPFVLSGLQAVQGRMDRVAYWVISDHFEELGRGPSLFHDGFGLLTVGNLRKPRYWAEHLAAHQGTHALGTLLAGDGAGTLVHAWATRHDDGTIDVLVWDGTINAALVGGDPRLDRGVRVRIEGLDHDDDGALLHGERSVSLALVDAHHSNILDGYPADTPWPDPALWAELRARDRLHTEPLEPVPDGTDSVEIELHLPMPSVARIRVGAPGAHHPA
ncbi:GH39 family glycosyl hydrolase [Xylanimonas sp. McL0601]|uniref:GH39 family glycosyl hydrolase n=1 Tax=Xylanimonas sp. McL0601 TaxID=3414739 RepID=UPI003CE9EB03